MAENTTVYAGGNAIHSGGYGAPITSVGGPPFVVVKDATAATTNPQDVYSALHLTDGNRDQLLQFSADSGSFIEFYHVAMGTGSDLTVATAPKIRVFGCCPTNYPRGQKELNKRRLPQDMATGNPLLPDNELWIPIVNPNYTAGTPQLELSNVGVDSTFFQEPNDDDVQSTSSGNDEITVLVSEPKYVFRSGCTRFICTVDTASSVTVTPDAGESSAQETVVSMVVARVVG